VSWKPALSAQPEHVLGLRQNVQPGVERFASVGSHLREVSVQEIALTIARRFLMRCCSSPLVALYSSVLGLDSHDRARAFYGDALTNLTAIKRRCDLENRFNAALGLL